MARRGALRFPIAAPIVAAILTVTMASPRAPSPIAARALYPAPLSGPRLAVAIGGVNLSDPWPPCVVRTAPIDIGVTEVGRVSVDARIDDITLASKAMQRNVHVDVMLPNGYADSGTLRYPVLYLLHGAAGAYSDWANHNVEGLVGDRKVIVVMPDDGPGGSYSDWYGNELLSPGPTPAWETHHLQELVGWVDGHYRSIAATGGRFIAGLSSGGDGAMKYAAANPGLFAAAGEFSGAVDTDLPGYYLEYNVTSVVSYLPLQGPPDHCVWGDPNTEQVIWEGNDPTYLAANLAGTRLFLTSGNGQPGPYDSILSGTDVVEATVYQMNLAFDAALREANIAHTDIFYGPGSHTWPYWQRDLTRFLAWLGPTDGTAVAAPTGFTFRSERDRFSAWGWDFVPHHQAREFTYLSDIGVTGLVAVGSGTLDVVSAALYQPGANYAVSTAAHTDLVQAGSDGRLRFNVDLGPSHTQQQTNFGPDADTGWAHVAVAIAGPN
jgi:S-formylglutathione hydrolase FrmB